MRKSAMTDEQKKNMLTGRQNAKEARKAAADFFAKYGELIITSKFWKNIDIALRRDIAAALKKADKENLKKEIKKLEAQLEAKKEALQG